VQVVTNGQAWDWTEATGFVGLGGVGGGALDVSFDGSVIVGSSGGVAFIWDAQHGMRSLQQVLTDELGLDLSGWSLTSASGISDDGRVIAGTGLFEGATEAWIAVIPEPGTLALVAIGLGMLGLRRRAPMD
jgi:uncharacterized membrane protein